jgi:PKD repeat protein
VKATVRGRFLLAVWGDMATKRFLCSVVVLSLLALVAVTSLMAWSATTPTNAAKAQSPPNRPANVSPANEATAVSLTPTLQSSAFSDPDAGDSHAASQWQITTAAGKYSSPIFDSGREASNLVRLTLPTGILEANTKYYWHVRHMDSHEDWSIWSVQTSFTTLVVPPASPPGQPSNVSPPNLATGINLTPTLHSSAFWGQGGTHAASQWQVTTVSNSYDSTVFDNVTYVPNLTSMVVPSGLLNYSTTYYWRVRYQDSQSLWSQWSSETCFATSPPALTADFLADATLLTVGQAVLFTDGSTGAIVSWTWDFGDGTAPVDWTVSTKPSDGKVSHIYAVPGTYTVSLKVVDSEGEYHTETKTGYIIVGDTVTPSPIPLEGGTIQTADGQIAMTFAARALTADATLTILAMSPSSAPEAPEGYKIGSLAFTLEAIDAYGRAVNSLSRPATLTVKYSEKDMLRAGEAPSSPVLGSYDKATGKWTIWSTTVNETSQTMSATTTHFGTWAILMKTESSGLALWAKIPIAVAAALAVSLVVVWAAVVERRSRAPSPA